jgi:hypothetical protein
MLFVVPKGLQQVTGLGKDTITVSIESKEKYYITFLAVGYNSTAYYYCKIGSEDVVIQEHNFVCRIYSASLNSLLRKYMEVSVTGDKLVFTMFNDDHKDEVMFECVMGATSNYYESVELFNNLDTGVNKNLEKLKIPAKLAAFSDTILSVYMNFSYSKLGDGVLYYKKVKDIPNFGALGKSFNALLKIYENVEFTREFLVIRTSDRALIYALKRSRIEQPDSLNTLMKMGSICKYSVNFEQFTAQRVAFKYTAADIDFKKGQIALIGEFNTRCYVPFEIRTREFGAIKRALQENDLSALGTGVQDITLRLTSKEMYYIREIFNGIGSIDISIKKNFVIIFDTINCLVIPRRDTV